MSTLKAKTIQPVSDSDTLVLRTGAADSLTLDTNGNATIRGELTVDGVGIGQGAGNYDTNTRVGYLALDSVTTAATTPPWNTAVGRSALTALTTSHYNTAVGGNALGNTNIGVENTAIGYNAGASNVDGNNHVSVGSQAGPNSASLINTTCVGRNAVASASNSVALGYNASASTPNSIYLGNSAVDALYMGNGAAVAPAYIARAWVNFDGNGAVGTNQTIRGSGNVSSVHKTNIGDYTINFIVAMPNINYCTQITTSDMPGGNHAPIHNFGQEYNGSPTQTVSSIRIGCSDDRRDSYPSADTHTICVVVFA